MGSILSKTNPAEDLVNFALDYTRDNATAIVIVS